MAGLAGVVGGLFLGPVVVPLVVFVVLLVTPLGAGVARRGRAMLGMVGVAVAVGALTMLLLVVVARTEAGGTVVALAAALLLAALGAGAYAALRLGRAPGGAVTATPSP